jgi:hypothetical protein
VAVDAFWMDETEITNNEYRQFVFWVRDSIIRKELAMQGIDDYMLKDRDDQPYEDINGDPIIDWDTPLDPSKDKEGNIAQIIEDLRSTTRAKNVFHSTSRKSIPPNSFTTITG